LAWSTDSGPFSDLDKELQKYQDYRGYCIVFAGNKSLHFHFLFDTRHLKYAPYDATFEQRLAEQDTHTAIMPKAHNIYWDLVDSLIEKILKPSAKTDGKLRSIFQWRRTPFGIRKLDKPSTILGLPAGTAIQQIVIKENIRTKAAKGSEAWIVNPEFSPASPLSRRLTSSSKSGSSARDIDNDTMFAEANQLFQTEWGDYPKLDSIQQHRGDWQFKFFNHGGDTSADSYIRGGFRKLDLCGTHNLSGNFFMPDGMTANQFGDYLARLCGQPVPDTTVGPATPETCEATNPNATNNPDLSPIEILKKWPSVPFLKQLTEGIEKTWPLPMRGLPAADVIPEYRKKLAAVISQCRQFEVDSIILSGEGIGKTTSHFGVTALEGFDAALTATNGHQRFSVFAFRSLEQPHEKAIEAEATTGRKVVVVQSFWKHYQTACKIEGITRIPSDQFHDRSINGILRTIQSEQPDVFNRLEEIRREFWPMGHNGPLFDSGSTLIFTSHPTVSSWHYSQLTRIWHHPDFEPFMPIEDQQTLRNSFVFAKVVYDEPEIDEILHVIQEDLYQHLIQQHGSVNWKDLPVYRQRELFKLARADGVFGSKEMTFESYEELMRVQLEKLERVEVDYDAIPFGHDNIKTAVGGKTGIGAVRNVVGIQCGAFSGHMKVSFQAARSIG
jgi:hypothetical protein